MAGIFVKYWRPFRGSDGKIGKTADQLLFPGTLQQFRQKFKGVCVIGYHNVDDDGVVLENSQVLLNEPYVAPQELAQEAAFMETLAAPQNAAEGPENHVEGISAQQPMPQQAPQIVPVATKPLPVQERIYESGDSFIKIAGDKVYQLRWKEYNDSEAPFDQRVRITSDGNGSSRVEVTIWEELSPGEVKNERRLS